MIFIPYLVVTLVGVAIVAVPTVLFIERRRDRRRQMLAVSEKRLKDLLALTGELEDAALNMSDTDPLLSDMFTIPIRKFRKEHKWF